MKILTVLSAFPPHVYGGGEISAINLSRWLAKRGNEVAVITTADKDEPEIHGELMDGLRVWRLRFPHPYTYWNHTKVSKWLKPLWYLYDHFHPRNRRLMAEVLDAFQPDCVQVHVVTGIGYNALREVGNRNIPMVYFLHDLNLACMWGGMFKNGKTCEKQCAKCKLVSKVRFSHVRSAPQLGFCSPSQAILNKANAFLPLNEHKTAVILNANSYPEPTQAPTVSDHIRFLYVGRLHATKGINLLLDVLVKLSEKHRFTLNILGDGPEAKTLHEHYGKYKWCNFAGHVKETDVSNAMAQSDVLCTPSIWLENSPGVVIHALSQGLPVLGSDIGGIPELITDRKNGRLITANDSAAWESSILEILNNPSLLKEWGNYAKSDAIRFKQETNGAKILAFFKSVVGTKA